MQVQVDWEPTRGQTVVEVAALALALALGAGIYAASGSGALAILVIAVVAYVLGRAVRPDQSKGGSP